MTSPLTDSLIVAHRILVDQGVLDAFGHISVRDQDNPEQFWLARAAPPSTVAESDMISFGMDGHPLAVTDAPLFVERFIHSEIYRARTDVNAICHHHSPSLMPFCITSRPLVPVSQAGAFMGVRVPVWDSATEFGDTAMLVSDSAQASSLAKGLGDNALVLMRGHGVTVVGSSIKELVFRSVYSRREANHLQAASGFGAVHHLSKGEIERARHVGDPILDRCWVHWLAALGCSSEKYG